ncbi:MAG: RHS repeat protein, partial [Proteobacteria bacterium]
MQSFDRISCVDHFSDPCWVGIQRSTDGTILIADENTIDVYKFDSSGRILSVINSVQGLDYLKYNYDTNGNLSSISDVYGQVTNLTRDSAGTVQSRSSPYGETTDISYHAEGLLASIQDPANRTLSYEYNQQGLLSRSRDAKGNYSSYEFDSRGLLTSDTDAAGFKKTYGRNYDLNHNDVEAKS